MNGLFIASGERWRRLRKMVNTCFNNKLMEEFMDVLNEESKLLCDILSHKVNEELFDVHGFVVRCMLDIICGTQLGVETKEQTENTCNFENNVARSADIIITRVYKPYLYPSFIFNLTSLHRDQNTAIYPINKFIENIIYQRKLIRKCGKENLDDNDDLSKVQNQTIYIDKILDNHADETDEELGAILKDVLVGGADLPGVTASSTILMLAMHPLIQEKVYQEQIQVCGNLKGQITIKDVNEMKYLDMVIKETLRHYSAPAAGRYLSSDIDTENYTLPAGTLVYISYYFVHRDSRYWQHPFEFYPDHFRPDNVAKRPKFSFLPFALGARSCPGQKYGLLLVKTLISYIVRNFILSTPLKMDELRLKHGFMLICADGYTINIKSRQTL